MDTSGYRSKADRKDTLNTLSYITPHLRPGDTVLDVGCGPGNVAWEIMQSHDGHVLAVDVVDYRRRELPHFALYDGVSLPFADASCDVVVVGFMLHHVPNEMKPAVLAELRRVTRRRLIVLEDTPRNALDRYFNRRHGEAFRKKIGSSAGYGFFALEEWKQVFEVNSLSVVDALPIGRFSRDWQQPFARSCFVLEPAR
ncbi:MAG: methyltransferase domain-containing protein [Deltaproteobacteria bacterium]|nr:methyltransferase domain-containing protein [Deltaproteobacteria bacterium]